MGSTIIASFELFMAFLKAVKGGGAAPKFAAALASAAIVVLDFLANFLIAKLGSALRKFAGQLKGLAQRLQKKGAAAKSKRKSRSKAKGRRRRTTKATSPKRTKPVRPRGQSKEKLPRRPKRKKRDDRRNLLSPTQIVNQAFRLLSQPAKSRDPAEAIAEKQRQASQLKARLQPRAPKGRRLVIDIDTSVPGVETDGDIDFRVSMSPTKTGESKVGGARTMPTEIISFKANTNKSPDWQVEYDSQLAHQEAAINAMDIRQWLRNRLRFEKFGRDPTAAAKQAEFRKEFRESRFLEELSRARAKLAGKELSEEQLEDQAAALAEEETNKFMKSNAALHDPDQIAGGSPAEVKRMGLAAVNSSIGSQWGPGGRAKKLRDAVVSWLGKDRGGTTKDRMSVKLQRG